MSVVLNLRYLLQSFEEIQRNVFLDQTLLDSLNQYLFGRSQALLFTKSSLLILL